jgi:uncharacterized membrane protein YoaK (UPF0700 family)
VGDNGAISNAAPCVTGVTNQEENTRMTAHHGNTPAAWTAVFILLVGFVLGGIGLVVDSWPLFWVGVAMAPFAGIVGKVMQKMGLGAEAVR